MKLHGLIALNGIVRTDIKFSWLFNWMRWDEYFRVFTYIYWIIYVLNLYIFLYDLQNNRKYNN